jgi:ABC-type lipoprotein release transport system permease subunit
LFGIPNDIRYSARKFVRAPGISLALLLTIALGIGSNVSVHRFVQGLTKPASPLASIDKVVSVFGQDTRREAGPLSYQDYLSLQRHPDAFEWIVAARQLPETVTLAGHSPTLSVAAVTPRLAGLLNLSLDQGIVISHRIWQSEFRAKADVRGEPVRVEGVDARVGDVATDWLEGVYRDHPVDLWIPLPEEALGSVDPTTRNIWVLARLRAGVSVAQAQIAVRAIGFGETRVVPYTGVTPEMANGVARVGLLLNAAAGLVFFIACANVASFLLGRASARSHETSVRVALGVSRGQLARGLLSDSIVISVVGGAFGVLLAMWTSHVLPALLFEEDAGRLVAAPDLFSIVAASAACVGITIVCGLLPVFAISHDRPATVLRRESAGPSTAIRRLRVSLVVAQMTSCCILVIATAFLFEGLHTALQTSVGRRLGQPILASIMTADPYGGIRYFEEIQRATHSVPGVSPMAWTEQLPGGLPAWRSFRVEPQHLPFREVMMDTAAFTANSIPRYALPPVAGRFFGVEDQTCRAAVANEEAAKALFGADTVGRSIEEPKGPAVEIIGVLAMRTRRPTIYYYDADQTGLRDHRTAPARFRAPVISKLKTAELDVNVVSAKYFAAMGLPLVAGRIFPDDPMSRGCRAGVINEEAAELYFNGNAVGDAVIDDRGRRTEIVGVVHSAPLGTFEPRAEPAIYFPMVPDCPRSMTLILGAREANRPLLAKLSSTMEAVPGRGPAPLLVRTLETYLSQTGLAPLRIATMIIGASATTAFILSVLGLFGALSDAARQRRRELAIRMALGAQRWHVIFQVLQEGGRLACAGALAGTLGSLLLSRMLARIAPGNGSPALWVWLAAPLVLAGAVAIASVLPARSSSLVNPLTIMRDEN